MIDITLAYLADQPDLTIAEVSLIIDALQIISTAIKKEGTK